MLMQPLPFLGASSFDDTSNCAVSATIFLLCGDIPAFSGHILLVNPTVMLLGSISIDYTNHSCSGLQMPMVDLEGTEGYKPSAEYVEDSNEALINLTDSTELLFLKLPLRNDFLSEIHGQKMFLTLQNDGKLATFEDSSGKAYDFVSFSSQEPDERVFVSSTEPKIAKISMRVSTVHYPDPEELENINSTNARHAHRNSSGATGTTSSRYFPMQSGGLAASSKGSRQKSSVSEVSEPSSLSKRGRVSKSKSKSIVSEVSHGQSTGISSMSPDHSHEGKSKRRKHKE
ncbi:Mediator-associated protein 2, partial [Mucuna pruriens]